MDLQNGLRHSVVVTQGSIAWHALFATLTTTMSRDRAEASPFAWQPEPAAPVSRRNPYPETRYRLRVLGVLHGTTGLTVRVRPREGRCVAPTRTEGGVLSCVSTAHGCTTPWHRYLDPVAPLASLVWRIRPWWPNALGRAQDAGRAHTPLVSPCRYCKAIGNRDPRNCRT